MSAPKPKDLVLVHGPTPDGAGVNVLRARRDRVEVGTMRPMAEGRPIHGEVVKLTPRLEMPNLYDAETQLESPVASLSAPPEDAPSKPPAKRLGAGSAEARATSDGPAQVASDEYRKNWDSIWKRPGKRISN